MSESFRGSGKSGRRSKPFTIFSIDLSSDATFAAWAAERRTPSSRREPALGLTAWKAEEPPRGASPISEDESVGVMHEDDSDEESDEDSMDEREAAVDEGR